MTEIQKSLPKWILFVSGFFALMEMLVSVSLCVSPKEVLETVDLSAKGVDYLIYMWSSRQFALGVIFAYATFKQSKPMLTLAYLFMLVMFVGDFLIGVSRNEIPLIAAGIVMCIVSALMMRAINKDK